MQSRQWRNRVSGAVAIPAVFALGVGITLGLRGNAGPEAHPAPPLQPPVQALDMQNAFEQVADKLRPSVVFIRSRQTVKNPSMQFQREENPFDQGNDGDDQSPFNFRFGPGNGQQFRMFPGTPGTPNMPSYPRHAEAAGSGVVVRGDGYILTNDHVVQGADKVTVELQDGREFTGKVLRDFRSDLALVKIDATGLPAVQLADSDQVKVGEWAIAFGAPFTLHETMTVGVVSALNREQAIGNGMDGRFYPRLIQTDASINPGNSGGPLVDIYGRVIGINVAIESPSGGNVGIGFTIPANTARYVVDQLISKGSVTRGYLGLNPVTLTYDQQQQYGVKEGAWVQSVEDGTPAQKAGIRAGDVIVRFSGQPIPDDATLRDVVARTKPGETVPVVIRNRDKQERTVDVTVGSAPDLQATLKGNRAPSNIEPPTTHQSLKLGVRVGDATNPDVRQQLNLKDDAHGVVIVEVASGSPAAEAGLQPGDIIQQLDGKAVTGPDKLTEIVHGLNANSVDMVIQRGKESADVTIHFDE